MTKPEQKETRRFSYTLMLNDNIIIQRLFDVDNFNPKSINSMDFKYLVDSIEEQILRKLKFETYDYILNQKNISTDLQQTTNDVIKLVINDRDTQIAYREVNASTFPTKVRHTIDIRDISPNIISSLKKVMSQKTNTLETTYLNYNLQVSYAR